ncbi:glycosyltransferase [Clostridium cellulovorans]|uniref:UDP-glucuronosyl/UDP-glucosyltransferase n=1 Tax=Clostridium cellulovorans (strain ATCC 35296 / DSM 3052 / OCM 3 / 743B) TaxID=573061 RepID=D9SND2_CLOC7|nr:glycosyltransferase [Clostridium cellulovorans]ADL53924.1 UDP-glucuronosyl/UDP-glucosyltransferase [Clostridium cellulovorans 743B]
MNIAFFTHSTYSHNLTTRPLIDTLKGTENEVYVFVDKKLEYMYSDGDYKIVFYPEVIEEESRKIYLEYGKYFVKDYSQVAKHIDELLEDVEKPLEYVLKCDKVAKEYLMETIKELDIDIIVRDTCVTFGRMIGEELNIPIIGYSTGIMYYEKHFEDNLRENLSICYGWELSHFSDQEIEELYKKCQESIKALCDKYSISKLPLFYLFDPGEKINVSFANKKLQPAIGEYKGKEYKTLTPKLFMDGDTNEYNSKEKLIYVATGSIASHGLEFYNKVINDFKDSEYKVIISFKHADEDFIEKKNIPSNIEFQKFPDQKEILKRASLFITHAGYNSMIEAVKYNVPMIAYPFVNDQHPNANLINELGLGVGIKINKINEVNLKKLSEFLINNNDIKNNIKIIKKDFSNNISYEEFNRIIGV